MFFFGLKCDTYSLENEESFEQENKNQPKSYHSDIVVVNILVYIVI